MAAPLKGSFSFSLSLFLCLICGLVFHLWARPLLFLQLCGHLMSVTGNSVMFGFGSGAALGHNTLGIKTADQKLLVGDTGKRRTRERLQGVDNDLSRKIEGISRGKGITKTRIC